MYMTKIFYKAPNGKLKTAFLSPRAYKSLLRKFGKKDTYSFEEARSW